MRHPIPLGMFMLIALDSRCPTSLDDSLFGRLSKTFGDPVMVASPACRYESRSPR